MAKGKGNAEGITVASGVYAALVTPRLPDKPEVDTGGLLEYLDAVVRTGVNGVVLFGSTGEFIHFEVANRMRVAANAIRRSRVPVLVNVSHSTLDGALALAADAATAGASGVLLMPPYFYRYNDGQILHFYELFAGALNGLIPIYLYNLPSSTNPISSAVATRLLCSGAFAGIKDSSGDWEFLDTLIRLRKQHPFQVLTGNEELYLRARQAGADGTVSGIAAALPELLVALDRAVLSSNPERAQRLNLRVEEILVWIRQFPATVAIKQIAVARKWIHNHFAIPPDPVTAASLADFEQWLSRWLPAVLSECANKA